MRVVIKHFNELTLPELYEIMRIRASVFVEEQDCKYCDADGKDIGAYHVWFEDEDGIFAYLRVLDKGVSFEDASIGRVLSTRRRCGYALKLVKEGIRVAKEKFGAESITIEAQTYVRELYEKCGFVQTSEEFLDVGIPHIEMKLNLAEQK